MATLPLTLPGRPTPHETHKTGTLVSIFAPIMPMIDYNSARLKASRSTVPMFICLLVHLAINLSCQCVYITLRMGVV